MEFPCRMNQTMRSRDLRAFVVISLDATLVAAGIVLQATHGLWTGGSTLVLIVLAWVTGWLVSVFMLAFCSLTITRFEETYTMQRPAEAAGIQAGPGLYTSPSGDSLQSGNNPSRKCSKKPGGGVIAGSNLVAGRPRPGKPPQAKAILK
jgi:hypothetical protein